MNEEFLQNLYTNYVENKFHKFTGLLVSISIVGLFLIFLHQYINEFFNYEWILFVLAELVIMCCWLFYKYYLPRNKFNKFGIVVGIFVDESYDKIKLKNNFIRVLRKKIKNENVSKYVHLIVLKNHLCENLDTPQDIEKINKKIKGHIFIYGDVRSANDGEKKIFINLSGYVTHRPVSLKISKELSNDFRCILPNEISFAEKVDFQGFKSTAEITKLTIKYILGVALYISGFAKLSVDFLLGLDSEIVSFAEKLPPNLRMIKNKIPALLSDNAWLLSKFYYEKNNFKESIYWLNESFRFNSNNYGAWILQGIYLFLNDNDPERALEAIKKAEKYSGGRSFEWIYSKIFLLFWLSKHEEAFKLCKKLLNTSFPNEERTILEVEMFNLKLCENYNEKPVVYFWLGFINLKKKHDLKCAKDYFNEFLLKADSSLKYLTEKTKSYLSEINREILK